MNSKKVRLENFLKQGKTIGWMIELSEYGKEPVTTDVSMWVTNEGKYRVNIEVFLSKHAMCEALYIRDEIRDFDNIEDAISWFENETSVKFFQMTAS